MNNYDLLINYPFSVLNGLNQSMGDADLNVSGKIKYCE